MFTAAADAMGGLDTYIGNAGITRDRMFHKLTDEDWDQVIAVNLTGVFNGLRACAPWLRTEGPGRVVLTSSVVAKAGNLGQMNYIASKAGIVGLVRSGALELARFGTTVNGIRPGFIATEMTAAMPPEAQAAMTKNPIGRAGVPADIAGAVAYLCSSDADFVTGHVARRQRRHGPLRAAAALTRRPRNAAGSTDWRALPRRNARSPALHPAADERGRDHHVRGIRTNA